MLSLPEVRLPAAWFACVQHLTKSLRFASKRAALLPAYGVRANNGRQVVTGRAPAYRPVEDTSRAGRFLWNWGRPENCVQAHAFEGAALLIPARNTCRRRGAISWAVIPVTKESFPSTAKLVIPCRLAQRTRVSLAVWSSWPAG